MAKQAPLALIYLLAGASVPLRLLPVRITSGLLGFILSIRPIRNAVFKTAVMERNLGIAFPDLNGTDVKALAKEIAANMGRLIAEIIHIRTFKKGKQGTSIKVTTLEGPAFDSSTSAIFVSVHAGSWELMPLIFKENARRFTVIYTADKNPTIDNFLNSNRQWTGANYVEKSKSVRSCFAAMKKGESLGLLIDQRVDTGLDVDFFGRPSLVTRLPASLAIKYSRPIIPFEVVRLGPGQLEAVFHAPIIPEDYSGTAGEFEMTQRMAEVMQDIITRNRDSWFCNKRRWRRPSEDLAPLVSNDPVAVDVNSV